MKTTLYNKYIKFKFQDWVLKDTEVLILNYHDISEDYEDSNTLLLKDFKRDIEYLIENNFTFIHFKDLLLTHPKYQPYVILTFDDGYSSVYDYVYEICKKNDIKFTIAPILGHLLFKGPIEDSIPHITDANIREMGDSELLEIINHTIDLHNTEGESLFFLEQCGMGIGKINLFENNIDYKYRIYKDINLSKTILDDYKSNSDYFVYPYGYAPSYSKKLIEENFKGTVSTKPGIRNYKIEKDLLDIPRITRKPGLSLEDLNIK